MVEVIVFTAYIAGFCFCIGTGAFKLLKRFFNLPVPGITEYIIIGVISLSVITGWWSIFLPVNGVYHLIMLGIAVICGYVCRAEINRLIREAKPEWPEIVCGAAIVLILAYAGSRGSFHTDTGIYHAAAIRQYEEYGILKGSANLQTHYGYNSSYLGFCALFTMGFILKDPLHITTVFLMILLTLDAAYNLKNARHHNSHCADAVRVCTILYVIFNFTGAISPATDYGTMLMTAYFLTKWAELSDRNADTDVYGLLSIYGLFLATMKLSAAMCFVVALLPISIYLREKRYTRILSFFCLGIICFCFYPVRNVIISGWLFYPFEAIDLFNMEWKVPVEYSLIDSSQIKVWGRCLYDVEKAGMPVSEWFPIWWEAQEHYDQMILYACILACALVVLTVIVKKRTQAVKVFLYLTIGANLALWFFTAPFIRYGLIFLISFPALAIAGFYDAMSKINYARGISCRIRFVDYIGRAISVLVIICFFARIDHYVMDDLVFIKQNIREPYYVTARPFDNPPMGTEYMGEDRIPVYYTIGDEEINSYYTFPSTCYRGMLDRCELIGHRAEDGFRAK